MGVWVCELDKICNGSQGCNELLVKPAEILY